MSSAAAAFATAAAMLLYLSFAHMSGLRPSTDKRNEGGRCSACGWAAGTRSHGEALTGKLSVRLGGS